MADHIEISWSVPLPSARYAEIAKKTLDVDEEYNSEIVNRWIEVEGSSLKICYKTARENAKILRTAISAFIINQKLVLETLKEFGN